MIATKQKKEKFKKKQKDIVAEKNDNKYIYFLYNEYLLVMVMNKRKMIGLRSLTFAQIVYNSNKYVKEYE